ncbi:MAG: hypothetical protein M1838_005571 [Thelocarpon superellum]|nr:MAG: hypothetical protein M1838_005571 [Thelocarpon superellum]
MKFSPIILSLATAGSLVAAQPHHHHRHADLHAAKRSPGSSQTNVYTEVETVYITTDGQTLTKAQVDACLADKSCSFVNNQLSSAAPSASPSPPPANQGQQLNAEAVTSTTGSSSAPASASAPAATSSGSQGPSTSGLGSDFPDGTLPCDFPSGYGAVYLGYLGLNGWSGIQGPDSDQNANVVGNSSNNNCSPGDTCSYACPEGYQKSQWPVADEGDGRSIGGLLCGQDNKLHLTNPGLSNSLCIQGVGGVSVDNEVGSIAVCRTDYPGTESETIPATYQSSTGSYQLTIPNGDTYYHHQGQKTSAQYYINDVGTTPESACLWGSATGTPDSGNWAPLNIGGSMTGGIKWLSIFPNKPTNAGPGLKFSISVESGNAPSTCYYDHNAGHICDMSVNKCLPLSDPNAGCTASIPQGQDATFKFTYGSVP